MFKRFYISLLSIGLMVIYPFNAISAQQKQGMSTTNKVLIGSAIGVGATTAAIVAAPYVLPVGTIVAAKTAGGAVIAKTVAVAGTTKSMAITAGTAIAKIAPVVHDIYTIVDTAYTIKGYFYPSAEQRLTDLKIKTIKSEQECAQLELKIAQEMSFAEQLKMTVPQGNARS